MQHDPIEDADGSRHEQKIQERLPQSTAPACGRCHGDVFAVMRSLPLAGAAGTIGGWICVAVRGTSRAVRRHPVAGGIDVLHMLANPVLHIRHGEEKGKGTQKEEMIAQTAQEISSNTKSGK